MGHISKLENPDADVTDYRAIVGSILCAHDSLQPSENEKNIFPDLMKQLKLVCLNCEKPFIQKRNLLTFYKFGRMKCEKCKARIDFIKKEIKVDDNKINPKLKPLAERDKN